MRDAAAGPSKARGGAQPEYLDASGLAKLYLPEPESETLNRALAGRRDALVSDLAVTEIVSSLARRRRVGEVSQEAVVRLQRTLLGHLDVGVYHRIELLPAVHRAAERLLLSAERVSLRAADALHLALAVSGEAATLITYDLRLADAAGVFGLQVFPEANREGE